MADGRWRRVAGRCGDGRRDGRARRGGVWIRLGRRAGRVWRRCAGHGRDGSAGDRVQRHLQYARVGMLIWLVSLCYALLLSLCSLLLTVTYLPTLLTAPPVFVCVLRCVLLSSTRPLSALSLSYSLFSFVYFVQGLSCVVYADDLL
ncbi:hypothetical protein BC834DRAFT_866250 [Gloeopeniophorella convolvens]|nr:hypothetical protein BC834DRAFT_866250 [Gloeopeniophorella convolvens]